MFGQDRRAVSKNSVTFPASLDVLFKSVEDQYHSTLAALSQNTPVLLVFLRQFGCCFCREALSDMHFSLASIESAGARLVLVHMSEEDEANQILASYGLADVSRISNPDKSLYRTFGLGRGSLDEMFKPRFLARAAEALLHGNPIGKISGDSLQMPGVFLIHRGRVLQTFVPETPEARPDYVRIVATAPVMA